MPGADRVSGRHGHERQALRARAHRHSYWETAKIGALVVVERTVNQERSANKLNVEQRELILSAINYFLCHTCILTDSPEVVQREEVSLQVFYFDSRM